MARIEPVEESAAPAGSQELAAAHVATGSRMTNMKWTAAHSPVATTTSRCGSHATTHETDVA